MDQHQEDFSEEFHHHFYQFNLIGISAFLTAPTITQNYPIMIVILVLSPLYIILAQSY